MKTKAFGNDNIIHLGTYYQSDPLHWKVKEYSKKASIFNNILTKIKDKFAFLFDRDCFT